LIKGLKNKRKKQKGFTLLEFLIAILVLSVGLLGMASLTGAMINYNRIAFNSTKAVALAQDKLEDLKNLNFQSLSSVPSGYDTESIFTRTWSVAVDTPDTGMATVSVTVTWSWKGDSETITLTSIAGR
jgi:type IV pilus assembly protein PilV